MAGEVLGSQLGLGTGGSSSGGLFGGVGWVHFSGTTSDTETLTIGGRVYEFDTDASIAGDVAIDISGGNSAAQSVAAAVAAINGDGDRIVEAFDGAGDILILVDITGTNPSLAEAIANASLSGAAMVGGEQGEGTLVSGSYALTAADITTLAPGGVNGNIPILCVRSTTKPRLLSYLVDDAGVMKSAADFIDTPGSAPAFTLTWQQVNTNYWALLLDEAAAAELAATDRINFLIQVL